MSGFIGRKRQLGLLNERYSGDKFEFVAIYGRRRVGKTALIEEFIKDKRAIFFTAMRTRGDMNLRFFNKAVKESLGAADDGKILYFDDLFKIVAANIGERLVLVIDEFPHFVESDLEILSALQIFIDHVAQHTKLFLILCGSSMSFMKRQVLGYESPLYGRATRIMHIRPMNYFESAEFLPGKSNYEKACIYGAVGGVPLYLSLFSGKGNIFDMMAEEFFLEDSVLSYEPESLLLQELLDPKKYNDIIEAMAKGKTKIKNISDSSGISAGEVSRCLGDLIDLGYVERVLPLNEKSEKRTRYYISDNLFRFYYLRVIGRKKKILGSSLKEISKNLKKEFPDYMGRVFEKMCAQYMTERMGYPMIDRWWGSPSKGVTAEIDVIGSVGRMGRTEGLFAGCKFTNYQVDMDDLMLLKEYADHVKGFDVKRYALFSRSGFTDRLIDWTDVEEVALVTLDMMYEDPPAAADEDEEDRG